MPFVLDASIVGCWCFHDAHDVRADTAWDLLELKQERARVPALWWFEVRNVVLLGERRGRITGDHSVEFLRILARLAIENASLPDDIAVLALARRHRLSFYDAVYLEQAKRERIALATLDEQLAVAARAEGVALVT